MRIARLTIACLLATALAACGSDASGGPSGGGTGGTGGTGATGGSGGDGGDGGAGGSGGGTTPSCGGTRVLALDGTASPAVLQDRTDTVDNWASSCTPEDSAGNDVVVHFRAGAAGFYRFSTAGSDFDTLIYALADCNNGFTELACNNDVAAGKQSQFLLDLQAGEELFVVVDSVSSRQSEPFTLTATLVEANPAVIDEIAAFANESLLTTGVRFSGRNPDSPVVGFTLQVYNKAGAALFRDPFTDRFDAVQIFRLTQENGTFAVEGSFFLGADAPPVGRVEISLLDENGLISELASAPTRAPLSADHGAPCDTNLALNICGSGDACVQRPPATEPLCSTATPPTLTSATATVNLDAGRWGLVVEGSDPEADVASVRVLHRRSDDSPLYVGQSGRTGVGFHQIGHDANGNFRGVVSLAPVFDGPCLAPANKAYSDCLGGGGRDPACYNAAVAQLRQCYLDTLPELAKVEVEVVDATGRVSGILNVDFAPAPDVELGGTCDPRGAIGVCPAASVCWAETPIEPEICRDEGPSCPGDYGVIDLLQHAIGNRWAYEGNNTESEAHGPASCGGGGPSDVFSFTVPATGSYLLTTAPIGTGADTILSVREYCQLSGYELGCSSGTALSAASSSLNLNLEAGRTIYIVVDSAGGTATGKYKLVLSRS